MRGHQPIIDMRKEGATPRIIFVDVGAWKDGNWKTWHLHRKHSAHVEIEDADTITSLDLRYATGMLVCVSGLDDQRVKMVGDAFVRAGADRVTTATLAHCRPDPMTGVDYEVVDSTDTGPA